MNINELSKIHYTFVRIKLDDEYKRYQNDHFDKLLIYIGEHYPITNRNPIGCAYKKIQAETNKLLHVSFFRNQNLKTSKREIASIRKSYYWFLAGQGKHYLVKIPYKIGFIFAAIIKIVDEISKKEDIPSDLKDCVGLSYGVAFYAFHIEQYDYMYRQRFREDARLYPERSNPAKLYNEFHSADNPFRNTFQ